MKLGLTIFLALVVATALGMIMSGVKIEEGKLTLNKPEFGFGAVIIICTFVISNSLTQKRSNLEGFADGYKEGLVKGAQIAQEQMIKALDEKIDEIKKQDQDTTTTSFY